MENKKLSILNNSEGQSTVEYLLVLVVVVSLGFTVFTSDAMKNLFGENSSLFAAIRESVQYSYRHGMAGREDNSNYTNSHHSYIDQNASQETRFFAPIGRYPDI